jgi:trk system potassium uptake protein TrkA
VHIVIMGCGRVGGALTVELAKAGHSVAIIDRRPEAFDRLPPGFDARTIVGQGFDREVLEAAGIKEARGFVAVSNGDNSNIVAARIAREHFHVPKVIARIYDPRRAEIYEKLDIPTIASVRWAAARIMFLLFHGQEEVKESFAGGTLLHIQREAPDHLTGKPIQSVVSQGEVEVIAIERGGNAFLPAEGATFQQGDLVHFVVTTAAVGTLDTLLEPLPE